MSPMTHHQQPVAIVGVAAKLSGKATSVSALWDLIVAGETTVSKVPHSRFNVDAFLSDNASRLDSLKTQYGNFIADDISLFDANFFSIAAQEADAMDPQQRILLETAYHALENAGIPMEAAAGSRTGVFIGASSKDYEALLLRDLDHLAKYHMMGTGTALLANRISHFFDLRGPSFTVDTGCSSSLVAMRQACLALETGECDTALVGGCHLNFAIEAGLLPLSNLGFLSSDGRCWGFDERANGFGRSEGIAFVVIKRLSDAQRDNDHMRAIIRATAVNQDGHTPGITMPSAEMQYRNILAAYESAGLDMESTQYFEAHGTGTQVGDLVESRAIKDAFKRPPQDPLYVGSVKKNIGHMEPGAGIAGMLKGMFMLERGLIPREIDVKTPNPAIPFSEWGIKLSPETIPWPSDGVRRLSLNSFGYGGTNAHVIMEDARHHMSKQKDSDADIWSKNLNGHTNMQVTGHSNTQLNGCIDTQINGVTNGLTKDHIVSTNTREQDDEQALFIFSASDEAGIARVVEGMQAHLQSLLQQSPGHLPVDFFRRLAYTVNERRSRLPWKATVVASSVPDLIQGLSTQLTKPVRSSKRPALTMVMSGQGANYPGMGLDLLRLDTFRQSIEDCERTISEFGSPWSIVDELAKAPAESRVHIPLLAQPLASALQLALVDLLRSWRIYPFTVIGHSSGEIAAAYATGAISRRAAMKIAYFRGIVAEALESKLKEPMTMSSVGLSQEDIEPYIRKTNKMFGPDSVTAVCINSNSSVTLAGKKQALDTLSQELEERGVFNKRLAVTVPYHSVHMQLVAAQYHSSMGVLEAGSSPPQESGTCTMYSSVTVATVTPKQLRDPGYWVQNLMNPVQFFPAFQKLALSFDRSTGGSGQILEVAPHAVLQRSVKDILTLTKRESTFEYDSVLFRNISALKSCLSVIGRLCCRNVVVDMARVNDTLMHQPLSSSTPLPLNDLPAYPFNHSKSYWHESRVSRNYRSRKHRTHELIGNRALDWNALEPRWRNMLRPADVPWIAESLVDQDAVFPPAALLLMPLECFRQLHDYSPDFARLELSNVSFPQSLVLASAGDHIEFQIMFQRLDNVATTQPPDLHYKFTVYVWVDDSPSRLCSGDVSGQQDCTEVPASNQLLLSDEQPTKGSEVPIDPRAFFEGPAHLGYRISPETQPVLRNMQSSGPGNAKADLFLQAQTNTVEDVLQSDSVIVHPSTLEGFLHFGKAALVDGRRPRISRLYPSSLAKLSISTFAMRARAGEIVPVMTTLVEEGIKAMKTNTVAYHDNHEIMMSVHGFEETSTQKSLYDDGEPKPALHCSYYSWKPDINLVSNEQAVQYVSQETADFPVPSIHYMDEYETIALYAIADAFERFDHNQVKDLPDFLQRYWAWMEHVFDRDTYHQLLDRLPRLRDPALRPAYLEEFAEKDPSGELLVETVKALVPVLNGEMTGLDLLFASDLASRFYASKLVFGPAQHRLASLLDLMAHKNPELRIVEVGAGTGGVTGQIIKTLSTTEAGKNVARYSEYRYTDISPSYFEAARERFAVEVDRQRIIFQTLDIESPPDSQNCPIGSYDAVVAFAVVHATTDIRKTLRNVRSLLKEGGRLLLYEPIAKEAVRTGLTFGLVKGWWLGIEPERQLSPVLSVEEWHDLLLETGFSGVDYCIRDMQSPDHQWHAIMMTSAAPDNTSSSIVRNSTDSGTDVVLVVDEESGTQKDLAGALISAEAANGAGLQIITSSLSDLLATPPPDAMLVFLLEVERSFLRKPALEDFEALRTVLTEGRRHVIWTTCGTEAAKGMYHETSEAPVDMSIFTGLGRALNTENQACSYVELALQPASVQATAAAIRIQIENLSNPRGPPELEITQRDGMYYIPRIMPNLSLTRHLHNQLVQPHPEARLLDRGDADEVLALRMRAAGDLETFYFEASRSSMGEVANDQVEVQVKAAGLNSSDLKVATGEELGSSFGHEFAGVVIRAGAASGFVPGDCVMGYCQGAVASKVRVASTAVVKMPANCSFEGAATLSLALQSAYMALVRVARLRPSDRILIHDGASKTGLAAICIAQAVGATVYTTVENDAERGRVEQVTHVCKTSIWDMRGDAAQRGGDLPFDVVLDIHDKATECSSWKSMATGATFIQISGSANAAGTEIQKHCQAIAVAYARIDMRQCLVAPSTLHEALRLVSQSTNLMDMQAKSLVFSASEIKPAFEALALPESKEATVVEFESNVNLSVTPTIRRPHQLSADATYVIAGGFGGLGRQMITWMADRGARNFIVPARSGAASQAAKDLIELMETRGVRVIDCQCDISSKESFQKALEKVQNTLPLIKGCLQLAMNLQDALFEKMSYDQWMACLAPKVDGTWTLHEVLPKGMDFFIMFASIAGTIGAPGQSNYAAGNTFLDRFAQYRRSLGEHGVSINLGLISDAGYALENQRVEGTSRRGMGGMPMSELLVCLEHALAPEQGQGPNDHILTGLGHFISLTREEQDKNDWCAKPLAAVLRRMGDDSAVVGGPSTAAAEPTVSPKELLAAAKDDVDATQVVVEALARKLSRVLAVGTENIDTSLPVYATGVDSLVALEVRTWFRKEIGADVSVTQLMSDASLFGLAEEAAKKSTLRTDGNGHA